MAQAGHPKEATMFERMNGRSQLLFSNKMTHQGRMQGAATAANAAPRNDSH